MKTQYQLVVNIFTGQNCGVLRTKDGVTAHIPFAPANTDYQRYLEWLAEGNEPLPADEPTV